MKRKKLILFAVAAVIPCLGLAQPLVPFQVLWERTFGGDLDDQLLIAAPTFDGGVILGGESSSEPGGSKESVHFGGRDWWIIRLDADGNKLWEQSYGGSLDEWLENIIPMPDGGMVVAGSSYSLQDGNKTAQKFGDADMWVVRLDANGNMLWDKTYGTVGTDLLYVFRATGDDGFILAGIGDGISGNKTSPGYGQVDYWVVRIDGDGKKLWDVTYGGSGSDFIRDILLAPDGGFLLIGNSRSFVSGNKTTTHYGSGDLWDWWVVKINSQGKKEWERNCGGSYKDALVQTEVLPDGGFMLAGYSASNTDGNKSSPNQAGGPDVSDYWLVRLDSNGNKLWEATYGGSFDDFLVNLRTVPGGAFFVGGYSQSRGGTGNKTSPLQGFGDAWVLRLTDQGGIVWDKSFGADKFENLLGLIPAANGGAFLASGLLALEDSGFNSGTIGFSLAQIDAQGNKLREFNLPTNTPTYFNSFGRLADGNFYAAGYTIGPRNIEFYGKRTALTWGTTDYRIVKIGPAPIAATADQAQLLPLADLQGEITQDGFLFSLVGMSNRVYVTEYSTNLVDWLPLRTNLVQTTDLKIWDTKAAGAPQRFYRARLLP